MAAVVAKDIFNDLFRVVTLLLDHNSPPPPADRIASARQIDGPAAIFTLQGRGDLDFSMCLISVNFLSKF